MVAASVLGHDPTVNDRYYTKDVSQLEARKKAVERMNLNNRSVVA